MKVAVITNGSLKARALIENLIRNNIDVVQIVRLKSKIFQKPSSISKGVQLGKNVAKFFVQDSKTKKALKFEKVCEINGEEVLSNFIHLEFPDLKEPNVNVIEVENVNSKKSIEAIKTVQPTICIVWGVGILREEILSTCAHFINAHTSILPRNKGTRSEFWQCYNQEYEGVGLTIHKVDAGIDTGDLIRQFKLDSSVYKEPYNLRAHNSINVIKEFPKIIHEIQNEGRIKGIKQEKSDFPVHKFKDITKEKRIELYSRLLSEKKN